MSFNITCLTNKHIGLKKISPKTHVGRRRGGEDVQLLLIHDIGTRWGEWSASRPGRVLLPVPIVEEAGWAPEPVWTRSSEEKSLASAGDRTSIARP
jgi:hypothetical protein